LAVAECPELTDEDYDDESEMEMELEQPPVWAKTIQVHVLSNTVMIDTTDR